MAKQNPSDLFRTLKPHIKKNAGPLSGAQRGEGMVQMRKNRTGDVYLLNNRTSQAWQIVGKGRLTMWNASDIEVASLNSIPEDVRDQALRLESPYYIGVEQFANSVALVVWTVEPDGLYWADEDGFGAENGAEVNLCAFVDTNANILIPFQPMDEAMTKQYRRQAVAIQRSLSNPDEMVEYVCLQPGLTLPPEENRNLAAHTDLLDTIISGAMYRLKAMADNIDQCPDYEGVIGVDTVLNPTPEHLSLCLVGTQEDDDPLKFNFKMQVALSRPERQNCVCQIDFESYTVDEIRLVLSDPDTVGILREHFMSAVDWLYSDKSGAPYAES